MSKMILGLCLATCSGMAMSVGAQTVAPPTAFMWAAPDRPAGWGSLGAVTSMVHIDLNGPVEDGAGGTIDPVLNPYGAGQHAARLATTLRGESGDPSTFKPCIMIKDFGKNADPTDTLDLSVNRTSFFRKQDILPGLIGVTWPDDNDEATKKPYLHPFLVNAGKRPDVATPGPMRAWMTDFVAGYKTVSSAPIPYGFFLDNGNSSADLSP